MMDISTYTATNVRTILNGEENRFIRAQPMGTVVLTGGGKSG